MRCRPSIFVLAGLTLLAARSITAADEPVVAGGNGAATYFPPPESKGGWRKLEKPEDIRAVGGMDPAKLDALKAWLLESDERDFAAVVIRNGHVVLEVERGNSAVSDARRVASVSKAICATVLAIASEESRHGRTPRKMSFDDPAFDFIPWAYPLSDPRKAQITVKQLLNHTSGICPEATGAPNNGTWEYILGHSGDPRTEKLAFDPGTGCGYSTHALHHAALVCETVTGMPYDQFAIKALFKPIGCEHWWFRFFDGDAKHGRHPSHSMGMPARDLARIAYCMLHGGRWGEKQVIPAWFVEETAAPTHNLSVPEMRFGISSETFSHGWELPARLKRTGPGGGHGIPSDARYKPGSGGQLIAFVPSLDLVVTRQTGSSGAWAYQEYLRRACQAVLQAGAESVSASQRVASLSTNETASAQSKAAPAEKIASYPKWSKIERSFEGPDSQGRGEPNPFDVRFDVTFTSPRGNEVRVPGFYNGDDRGGLDGNVWKVRFSADEEGVWSYRTASDAPQLDGVTGRFTVTAMPADAQGFWRWGRLEYTGTAEDGIRYLKFRDGPYWLKAGCDDPENFLGRYSNYDTLEKRKAAVDYLAQRGINSFYIMTHNLEGDDNDVWPWLGDTPEEAKANAASAVRFNLAKLDEWHELFEYMQSRGVVPYIVLEDDSAWTGYEHRRYYRELVARFGYLPALLWNLGEEHNENYTLDEGLTLLEQLDAIDPYDHPCGIHNVNRPTDAYIRSPHADFTSIQTGSPGTHQALASALAHNRLALEWIERCRALGQRILVVNFDEGRPEEHRASWWSAYTGGGVWEAHVLAPYDQPMSAREPLWAELGGARAFFESLPFWRMQPAGGLVVSGEAFCLAKQGEAYGLYLPRGGCLAVELTPGRRYQYAWWNPANGWDGQFQDGGRVDGGVERFTAPADGDWALRIVAEED